MMKFKIFCVLSLFLLGEQGVFSWEIGFLFNNDFRLETMAGASERPRELHESIKVSNWLSFFPTTNTSFYFKVSLNALNTAILSEDSNWNINGELDIARLSIFPAYFFFAELGRIPHTDINKLIANSFFDGTSISITGTRHAVTASALYTGLLSKESAKIMLTKNDLTEYYTSTYFAQPHILLSLSYHYLPSFFNGDSSLEAQAIRHIDMRENSTNATTFALGKASLAFSSNLNLVLGAAFSIAEDGDDTNYSISSLLDLVLNLNRSFPSRLSLELRLFYGSFTTGEPMPVVNSQQLSFIYNPALRRLAMARVSYLVRLNSTLSFDAVFSLFTRLDTEILPEYWIYDAYTNKGATGFLLGEEFVLGALWTPFSDFSLNCALGFFFPDNGPNSVYIKEAPVKCDIRLGILISF